MSDQKREHFRIDYPVKKRAKILIKNKEYEIVDISQRGVKVVVTDEEGDWQANTAIRGAITFLTGEKLMVDGEVIRVTDRQAILYLKDAIPLSLMNEEHRRVINLFRS